MKAILNPEQWKTVAYLREIADGGEVNIHRDEYGIVFDMYEDGLYSAGDIATDGEVSWY